MQFKIYDILSSLIPGTLVIGILLSSLFFSKGSTPVFDSYFNLLKELSGIATSIFLVISYLIGYLIHALGSWVEPFLWFTWGGRPSELLLKNKTKRLGMVFFSETLDYLIESSKIDKTISELEKKDFRKLFQVAKNKAILNANGKYEERLSEFNNSYIFSRNILIAITAVYIILIVNFIQSIHWTHFLIGGAFLVLFWLRCRDKAIYYSREILTVAYSKK